jgi:hypothetical protein
MMLERFLVAHDPLCPAAREPLNVIARCSTKAVQPHITRR